MFTFIQFNNDGNSVTVSAGNVNQFTFSDFYIPDGYTPVGLARYYAGQSDFTVPYISARTGTISIFNPRSSSATINPYMDVAFARAKFT